MDVLTPALFVQVTRVLITGGRFFSVERGFADDRPARVVDRFRASLAGEWDAPPTFAEIRRGLGEAGLQIVAVSGPHEDRLAGPRGSCRRVIRVAIGGTPTDRIIARAPSTPEGSPAGGQRV